MLTGNIVIEAADPASAAVREKIDAYRHHRDIDRLIQDAFEPATRVVRLCAYLFGHLDAFGDGLASTEPVQEILREHGLNEIVENMVVKLRALWDRRNQWRDRSEFAPLHDVIRETTTAMGLRLTVDQFGGDYLEVT